MPPPSFGVAVFSFGRREAFAPTAWSDQAQQFSEPTFCLRLPARSRMLNAV